MTYCNTLGLNIRAATKIGKNVNQLTLALYTLAVEIGLPQHGEFEQMDQLAAVASGPSSFLA
jgi:hypothetical protein